MVKKQQMRWTLRGAQLPLQVRARGHVVGQLVRDELADVLLGLLGL
jgi:hypothetical protein